MSHARKRLLLPLTIIVAVLAVSTASIFIRYAQQNAPSLAIAALRLTFASILLAPLALTRHRSDLLSLTRQELLLGMISGLFLAVHFATWISSLEYTTVASSVVLVSTGPLWVALLSPIFLNERMSPGALAGLGLALLGGAAIALSGACTWDHGLICTRLGEVLRGRNSWGDFLALAGAWAVTGYLIIGRRLRVSISLIPYIFLVYGTAALTLLIFCAARSVPLLGYRPITYLWLLLLAAIPQLIGHSTYNWALKFLPAAMVAVTTLGEPIGSATLAYFLLQETPTWTVITGGILILLGIYIATRPSAAIQAAESRHSDGVPLGEK